MQKNLVSIVRYEKPRESVRRAVTLAGGLAHMPAGARVFVKPNIVFWTRAVNFPKWGVITTSRVVADMIEILKDSGAGEITIGEGMVLINPEDTRTMAHAFKTLGYEDLKKRYGVKLVNLFERPFRKVDLGDGVSLKFNTDILNSDYVVSLPVLKTHAQTVVSLGIKNLKGAIDIPSRKKCHNQDPGRDLHFMVSRLADRMPPLFTLADGIYTAERGPGFDGRMHRSNLLIASSDIFAADCVGAKVLGYEPDQVPYLVHAAAARKRPLDFSDIQIAGESIGAVAKRHEHSFPYTPDGSLPVPMHKMGIRGLSYKKYDLTMCTYCSIVNGAILGSIVAAWKGTPWEDVEVLTGKSMTPTPGRKKTVLIGKCIYTANKDNPDITEMIAVKGCPPQPKAIVKALHQAGIPVDSGIFDKLDEMPGMYMRRYENKPEFDESFFRLDTI